VLETSSRTVRHGVLERSRSKSSTYLQPSVVVVSFDLNDLDFVREAYSSSFLLLDPGTQALMGRCWWGCVGVEHHG